MAEDVLVVAPRLDKPIALLKIPPLHRALLLCGSAILCSFCKGPLKQVAYFKGSPDLSAIGRTKENSETRHARRKRKGAQRSLSLSDRRECCVLLLLHCRAYERRWSVVSSSFLVPTLLKFSSIFLSFFFGISPFLGKCKKILGGRTLSRLKWKARQWRNSF